MDTALHETLGRLGDEGQTPDAGPDPQVMQMVQQQLQRQPPPPVAALYGRAIRINPRIRQLTVRQFNARYPLQVRRKMKREQKAGQPAAGDGRKPPRSPGKDEHRTRVRAILLRYAKAVVAARTTANLIDVLEGVDSYVDAVVDRVGNRDIE